MSRCKKQVYKTHKGNAIRPDTISLIATGFNTNSLGDRPVHQQCHPTQ